MIDKQELVFVVDEKNKPLNPELRKTAHSQGLWHRTSGIWVINHKKQILCQQRSLKKDIKPGYWEAFFGGHVAPGEEYLHNATNELNEELGLKITAQDLVPYKVVKSDKPTHKEFQALYGLKLKDDVIHFAFEKEEIDQVKWMDIEDIKQILLIEKPHNWVLKPWDNEILQWLETL